MDTVSNAWSVVRAPAKLNLTLRVLRKRSDGFHDIVSCVQGIELFDDIAFQTCSGPGLFFTCDDLELANDSNLINRAVLSLAKYAPPSAGLRVHLSKRIPVGGGMGGGSSDAAATLEEVNRRWRAGLSREELAVIGSELGSDIPLFFSLPAAQISGRGERVRPIPPIWRGWFLVLASGLHVDTGQVYSEWRKGDAGSEVPNPETLMACRNADELADLLFNDLEAAVIKTRPPMGELLSSVRRLLPRPAQITGAGGVLYLPVDDEEEGRRFADRVRSLNARWTIQCIKALVS